MKRAKKEHFANLDVNYISDKKNFGRLLNLFSNKVKAKPTMKLVENNEKIDDEIEIAKLFNEYFVNVVKNNGISYKRTECNFHRK